MDDKPATKVPPTELSKPPARKNRFRQLRRAMSLTHMRHKPVTPDTAPPTPTVPSQIPSVPSVGIKSLESLAHWQLPDPTTAPSFLDGNAFTWPPSLAPTHSSAPRSPYVPPLDQLSPPSSIPSESEVIPPHAASGTGIPATLTPNASPNQSPRSVYPPSLYDVLDLSDSQILEKDSSGKVVAGTPEGLVTYITSPDCLDYTVLSDFFLMYRKFLEPCKLLHLLCARFEWALTRGAIIKPPDNEGRAS
jgi:RasGEF N-terminal motif